MITVCNGSMTPVDEYEYFRWHTACIGFLTLCSITSIIRIQNPSNLLIIITSLSQKQVDTHYFTGTEAVCPLGCAWSYNDYTGRGRSSGSQITIELAFLKPIRRLTSPCDTRGGVKHCNENAIKFCYRLLVLIILYSVFFGSVEHSPFWYSLQSTKTIMIWLTFGDTEVDIFSQVAPY